MNRSLLLLTLIGAVPPLQGQQPDSILDPVLQAGRRMHGSWTTLPAPDQNGLRSRWYRYRGSRDEHVTITLQAGFRGGIQIAVETGPGTYRFLAVSDSLRTSSQLELKLPSDGTYWVGAVARLTGSYTLLLRSEGAVSAMDWSALYPGGGDPVERYALLVGVNDYPGVRSDLGGGPLADVDLMRSLLIEKYGFLPANVLVLRDVEGNREQVIQAFRRHLGQAGPRGAAVFYYSGHGIQLSGVRDSSSAGRELDSRDEALALWGTQGDLYGYLLDDELGILIDELRTNRVLVVLDDCHSGTATRGGQSLPWSLVSPAPIPAVLRKFASAISPPPQAKRVMARDLADLLDRSVTPLTRGSLSRKEHVVLSAAADPESALGVGITLDDGTAVQVGLFTVYLYETLKASTSALTFQTLLSRIGPQVTQQAARISGKPQTPQGSGLGLTTPIARFLAKGT